VAARARREPAAERREFERLRKVSQCETVWGELVFEIRAERAAADPREPTRGVDLVHARERAKIKTDDGALVARCPRSASIDAADDRRPAAERNHCPTARITLGEHAHDLGCIAWLGDDIRCICVVAREPGDLIDITTTARARSTLVRRLRREVGE